MHCISVYLIKKEELRDDKLSSLLDDKKTNIKFTELNGGILATPNIPNIKEFGKDKTVVYITTDYFGGIGDQTAEIFINNKKVPYREYESNGDSINMALRKIGIKSNPGMDEFDTIGLGRYRTNEDFK